MEQSEPLHHSEDKKSWTPPDLVILEVRNTMASGDLWQFVQDGDFWKRELLDS